MVEEGTAGDIGGREEKETRMAEVGKKKGFNAEDSGREIAGKCGGKICLGLTKIIPLFHSLKKGSIQQSIKIKSNSSCKTSFYTRHYAG